MADQIDRADTVFHRPTGETWIVRRVQDDRLYWCGWPPGCADLADCELIAKATPEDIALLDRAESGGQEQEGSE